LKHKRPPDEPLEVGEATTGVIVELNGRGFGWLTSGPKPVKEDLSFKGQPLNLTEGVPQRYFFHATACPDFDSLQIGDTVEFTPTVTVKGPRAIQVRRKNGD
jgi:hypothetical protein